MTPKTKLASGWGIAGIIVAIAGFLLTNVLASKPALERLEEREKNHYEELRQSNMRIEAKVDKMLDGFGLR
jgi:cell division protein FtsB